MDGITSTCVFCGETKNVDTELMVVTDDAGNLELRCSLCIDGEEIRNATDWIRQEINPQKALNPQNLGVHR